MIVVDASVLAEALGGSLVTGDRAIARTPGLACDVETIAY